MEAGDDLNVILAKLRSLMDQSDTDDGSECLSGSFAEIRAEFVEKLMVRAEGTFGAGAGQGTLTRALLEELTLSAMDYALSIRADTKQFRRIILPSASEIINKMRLVTFRAYIEADWPKYFAFWQHEKDSSSFIFSGDTPYIDQEALNRISTEYLKTPFRSQLVDRTLVDMLIAVELYSFGKLVFAPPSKYGPSEYSIYKTHVAVAYLTGQLVNGAILLGLAYIVKIGMGRFVGQEYADWIAIGLVLLLLINLLIGTISLPFAWRRQAKARHHNRELVRLASDAYLTLKNPEVVSSNHVREVAKRAEERGIAWPGPLFAVLDDNIRRTGLL